MPFSEIVPIASSVIPHPRSGHRAVATDADLWIFGGYHPTADDDAPFMFNEVRIENPILFSLKLIRSNLFRSFGDLILLFNNGI